MKSIVITAGHSNTDPGAVYDGVKEADFVADMRNYVAYYLRNRGVPVTTDGEGRTNAPLSQAIALARKADIAIEFHLNASSSRTTYGVEVLGLAKHKKLAQALASAVVSVTDTQYRGDFGFKTQEQSQHSRLGFVQAGGVIVELEFLSNPSRFKKLQEQRWLVAKAIAEAIINYAE